MDTGDISTEELLRRVAQGERAARDELFARHRKRLLQMISVRMDPRLAARIDASDVIQETLAEVVQKMPDYLRNQPLPFYPWLRQMALERLVDLSRQHIRAQRRSVNREEELDMFLADRSAIVLADRLFASGTSPSGRVRKAELRNRVRLALGNMAAPDREVLVLRYLEQLTTAETAAILGITEQAVRSRHRRALERLRDLLDEELMS